MRSPRTARLGDERGQILVIVAGGLIGLLAIAALVLEGGTLVLTQRDGQNAADLAALAGTRVVSLHYTDGGRTEDAVYEAIEDVITANGCGGAGVPCDWTARFVGANFTDLGPVNDGGGALSGTPLGVAVGVTRHPDAIMGRILGFGTWDVSTDATAMTGKGSGVPAGVMLPIAVCGWDDPSTPNDCIAANDPDGDFIDFQPGVIYDLTDGMDAPGGFGWLSWTGSNSANIMADRICNPQNPSFSIDSPYDDPGTPGIMGTDPSNGETWFPIDPGKSNADVVRDCLDEWIDSGATVLVPIYDLVVGEGNNAWYHLTGVAAFVLTAREQPAIDQIQGYFVEYFPIGEVPGGITTPPGEEDVSVQILLVK